MQLFKKQTYFTWINLAHIGICLLLLLFNSCKLASDFPLSVEDIDTLSVYNAHHQDSTIKPDTAFGLEADSTILVTNSPEITIQQTDPSKTLKLWTICAGVFKKKQNAKRMFEQLNHYENTYLISRDSSYLVTIGTFITRDSAQQFRTSKALTGTYIMKLRPDELLSDQTE